MDITRFAMKLFIYTYDIPNEILHALIQSKG